MAMHSPCTVALQCTCLQGAVLGSAAQDVGSGPRQLVCCCACSQGAVGRQLAIGAAGPDRTTLPTTCPQTAVHPMTSASRRTQGALPGMHARCRRQALCCAEQCSGVAGRNFQCCLVLGGALGKAAQRHVDGAALRQERAVITEQAT